MKAVICGAGIAGLAVAQRLETIGWDVVVVEKAPGPRPQGYMIDFFGPGYEAAEEMGILPRYLELGHHVKEFGYLGDNGEPNVTVNYKRFARAAGGKIVSILRPHLEQGLREALGDRVEIRYRTGVAGVDDTGDGVSVTFTDGDTVDADLLIGADGIHSTVRRLVFGPESDYFRYLGMHTAAYLFDDPQLYPRVQDCFKITDTLDRQMGFYGINDGRVACFIVHRSADPRLPDDPRAEIRARYGGMGPFVDRALRHCPGPDEIYYDQVAQIEMPQWYRGRTLLLGDSAYAVSLLAGQGASLAIAGAYVLGRQLADTDVDTAIARYQRLWHPIVTERQRTGRRVGGYFLPSSRTQLWLRRQAMRAMVLPGVDRYLGSALIGKPHRDVRALTDTVE